MATETMLDSMEDWHQDLEQARSSKQDFHIKSNISSICLDRWTHTASVNCSEQIYIQQNVFLAQSTFSLSVIPNTSNASLF